GLMHLAKAEMLGSGRLIATDVLPDRLEHAGAFGADLVLDASTTTAEERREAVLEAGAFVDLGPVPVTPNRDVSSPGVAILGIGGEGLPQYAPALRMLARH